MDRHSSYIFIWLQLELCAMAVLLTKGECRGTECPDLGLGGCRPSGLVSGGKVPAFAVVDSTARDIQTLGRLANGELLNSGSGDDQTPLGSHTPTGLPVLRKRRSQLGWAGISVGCH